jgi:hypothetical protein
VGGETTANLQFGQDMSQIILVPILVGIAEDEVEGILEGRHQCVGIAQPGIDKTG